MKAEGQRVTDDGQPLKADRRPLTAEIVRWLRPDGLTGEELARLARWSAADWQAARTATLMQGLAGYFHCTLAGAPLEAVLAQDYRQWLATEYANNQARIARLHEDLHSLLHEANRAGIAVAPLKGSLLTTKVYPDPAVRPMADIDLLVHPTDRETMRHILERRGYRLVSPVTAYDHHDKFIHPENSRVVSYRGEHPENPRPMELHTRLSKIIWAVYDTAEITDYFWETSRETEILGERAVAPSAEAQVVYLAIHALSHFVIQTGRALHWVDLAAVLQASPVDVSKLPWPDEVYPVLRLVLRAQIGSQRPGLLDEITLDKLGQQVHPDVRRWCETVPLDERCGLVSLPLPKLSLRWQQRWNRWRPSVLRLRLAYGDGFLPTLVLRYLGRVVKHAVESGK